MSIQMTLVFSTLCVEMAILFVLVCPLPQVIRKKIVKTADFLNSLSNFKIGLLFFSLVLGMQFIDCLNKLRRFDYTKDPYFASNARPSSLSYDQLASKFYAQRNLYLSGAVLYLEVAIFTVMSIFRKLVSKENNYRSLTSGLQTASLEEEVKKYKELIRVRKTDVDALKKQIEGLQASYDKLHPTATIGKDD